MELENRKSTFIRDLIVRILLIVLFIFLLMYLFPMPNLNAFYDAVFNDNIQTMKEAAEKYYTTDRMPKKVGSTSELSLQDMIDNKLIIPFVDKDGNSCDTNSSYVKVTKKKDEYVLKVSLTCGKQSDYIIDHIGCYNFCKDQKCTQTVTTPTTTETVTPVNNNYSVTPSNNVVNNNTSVTSRHYCSVVSGKYYGAYGDVVSKETYEKQCTSTPARHYCSSISGKYYGAYGDVVSKDIYEKQCAAPVTKHYCEVINGKYYGVYGDTVSKGVYEKQCTTPVIPEKHYCEVINGKYYGVYGDTVSKDIYEKQCNTQDLAYEYEYEKYNTTETWTILDWQDTKLTETEDLVQIGTKVEYTGQKKVTEGTTLYKHIKYAYKDNWTVDSDWSTEVKETSDTVKLYATRTLYKGYKEITSQVTKYRHVKNTTSSNVTTTPWTSDIKSGSNVKLIDTRYKVSKTKQNTGTTTVTKTRKVWGNWQKDYVWRTSKPSDTSTKQWGSVWDTREVGGTSGSTSKVKIYDDYKSTVALSNTSTYTYVFTGSTMDVCSNDCNGQATRRIYHYIVYKNVTSSGTPGTKQYRYLYRTAKLETYKVEEDTLESQKTDTKWVSKSELKDYTSNGYMIVDTQYKYQITDSSSTLEYIWTDSSVSPEGYTFTGQTTTQTITKYEEIDNWVTSTDKLGEYTNDIVSVTQYKYKYNNPTKYIEDTIYTESIIPEEGYTYTGQIKSDSSVSYVDLGKWVETKEELGEYKYNVETRYQYQYKKRTTSKIRVTKWVDEGVDPGEGWSATGNSRVKQSK